MYLKFEGPADPTTTGSFGNVFRYKNWDLNVFVTYSFGNKVRLNHIFNNRYDDMDALPKEFRNRWTYSGDEALTISLLSHLAVRIATIHSWMLLTMLITILMFVSQRVTSFV